MNIQGYQKMSLLDYPEHVACTVFTGGCNLHCPFCHNAGLVRTPVSEPNATEEVLRYLERRRGLLDGVCISGGEPLLQPDLETFLRQVKHLGYLVKLDTNGSLPRRLAALLSTGLVDYVAMDVKSSPAGYAAAVGGEVDMSVFEASVKQLLEGDIPHEFRTTAVKGIHTLQDFEEIGRWLKGAKRYYLQRFVDSGNLLGEGCGAFSDEEMAAILQVVRQYIPEARLRGQN